jgi:demethylmenaquinone methyltransferase / 2-methoxy-6-polyprenyl-1,4-benzoquinol methylase
LLSINSTPLTTYTKKGTNEFKQDIKEMFSSIAPAYDFLNHLLSFGIDKYWRKKAIAIFLKHQTTTLNTTILDLATGTGDLAFALEKRTKSDITGCDLSPKMIEIAQKKQLKKNSNITFQIADAEQLPFKNNQFNLISISFGIRNVSNLNSALSEINRLLKHYGFFLVLEFSKTSGWQGKLFNIYFKKILPLIGRIVSGNKTAYHYLPESVEKFHNKHSFVTVVENFGFSICEVKTMTFGLVNIYLFQKKQENQPIIQ